MKLGDLSNRLSAHLEGDPKLEITGVAGLEDAHPGDLTFLANRKYKPLLTSTRASAILLAPNDNGNRFYRAAHPNFSGFSITIARADVLRIGGNGQTLNGQHGDVVFLAELRGGVGDGVSGLGAERAGAIEAEELVAGVFGFDNAVGDERESAVCRDIEMRR